MQLANLLCVQIVPVVLDSSGQFDSVLQMCAYKSGHPPVAGRPIDHVPTNLLRFILPSKRHVDYAVNSSGTVQGFPNPFSGIHIAHAVKGISCFVMQSGVLSEWPQVDLYDNSCTIMSSTDLDPAWRIIYTYPIIFRLSGNQTVPCHHYLLFPAQDMDLGDFLQEGQSTWVPISSPSSAGRPEPEKFEFRRPDQDDCSKVTDDAVFRLLPLLASELLGGCPYSQFAPVHDLYFWLLETNPSFLTLLNDYHGRIAFEILAHMGYADDRAYWVTILLDMMVDLTGWYYDWDPDEPEEVDEHAEVAARQPLSRAAVEEGYIEVVGPERDSSVRNA